MEFENLLYSIEDEVATIVLHRPEAMNALSQELLNELGDLLDVIAKDENVKAVVLTGSERAFAAGADITGLLQPSTIQSLNMAKNFHRVFDKLEELPKPVIAAVSGLALGGGCELALTCDIRIAAEGAKFGLPEINLGIIPGSGGTQRLPRVIGAARAKEMIFTGEILEAGAAVQWGLVNRVVPKDKLLLEAKNLALKLAGKPQIALAAAKRAINTGLNCDLKTAKTLEIECVSALFATEDQKEGVRAFIEKRPPVFNSR